MDRRTVVNNETLHRHELLAVFFHRMKWNCLDAFTASATVPRNTFMVSSLAISRNAPPPQPPAIFLLLSLLLLFFFIVYFLLGVFFFFSFFVYTVASCVPPRPFCPSDRCVALENGYRGLKFRRVRVDVPWKRNRDFDPAEATRGI